ncbi:hypothetical protein CI102_4373 [Trichoderma harzianum]|uniref:Uncharacterized protein n=1 Tax=Trichoderma harzianum CBS 226.95 TaxID=983964 RepID=A0A2T3ZU90_TRIHA|nr:hypothetical protein M431DRAFT_326250 [Trichoderma harzianum CBS 226.95]PKK51798.1 hypothetical protein CI102_4373 [Trichoderma harzianum]PTB48374.1 hypothetical protein M431DRAFT_326250 [Trichoderma harzianum CBS 226.95]
MEEAEEEKAPSQQMSCFRSFPVHRTRLLGICIVPMTLFCVCICKSHPSGADSAALLRCHGPSCHARVDKTITHKHQITTHLPIRPPIPPPAIRLGSPGIEFNGLFSYSALLQILVPSITRHTGPFEVESDKRACDRPGSRKRPQSPVIWKQKKVGLPKKGQRVSARLCLHHGISTVAQFN